MAQLEIVKQETKTSALMTEPMPQVELQITPCQWIMSRGDQEGEPCGKKAFDGAIYCSGHQITATRKKAKEEKKEAIKEVNVEVKASSPQVPLINVVHPPSPPLPASMSLPLAPVVVHPPPAASIDEILVIMRNFSIAMVNLTELLKRH